MSVEVVTTQMGGVPAGGTAGQRLAKSGSGDTALAWQNVTDGLSTGQIIIADDTSSQLGFLKCDGSFYLRASYPALATEIGAPKVLADATTTYNNVNLLNGGIYGVSKDGSFILLMNGTTANGADSATGSALYTSAEGSVWSSRVGFNIQDVGVNTAAIFGGSTFVIAKTHGGIAYTSTLAAWTAVDNASTPDVVLELAYGGTSSRFIAVGYSVAGDVYTSEISYSSNGSVWTMVSGGAHSFGSVKVESVAADDSTIIALGSNGAIKSSADGATWVARTIPNVNGIPRRVSYVNSVFIVVTSTGYIYSTTDGITWTSRAIIAADGAKIYWNGDFYIATPISQSGFFSSIDLNTWNGHTDPGPTTAVGGKFWTKSGGTIYSRDANSYDADTEFPVPTISFANSSLIASSQYKTLRGWIKT